MKLRYVRAFIVLLAGLIALIINICLKRQITLSLFIVLITILIFYVIGTLVIEILQKGMEQAEKDVSASAATTDDVVADADGENEGKITESVGFDEDEEEI